MTESERWHLVRSSTGKLHSALSTAIKVGGLLRPATELLAFTYDEVQAAKAAGLICRRCL